MAGCPDPILVLLLVGATGVVLELKPAAVGSDGQYMTVGSSVMGAWLVSLRRFE